MRLVEFDLDLDYVANEENIALIMKKSGCERNEATRQDYEINWKGKRRDFSSQTRCMTAFFSRLLGGINTEDCKKLLVRCVPEVYGKNVITTSDGFCDVQIQFDYDSFMLLDNFAKKKATLELLMKGIRLVAEDKNWDMKPFESTYVKIVSARYINEWTWQKSAKSPNNKNVAHILLQHEVSEINIFIIVSDKSGNEILRKKVMSELPDEWYYARHLGEIKWVSNSEIVLVDKKKDTEWLVNMEDILSGQE